MTTNASITLWHKKNNPVTRLNEWIPIHFESVSMQNDTKVNVLDDGLKSANTVKFRIPTTDNIIISNGDKIEVGTSSSAPPDDAYTVIGFSDNRKGSPNMHHWKVVCA